MATSTSDVVLARLKGRRLDLGGILFEVLLLLALFVSLSVLVALLADVLQGGLGTLTERGTSFLTDGLATFSADSAGLKQGLIGSALTVIFVILVGFPVGIGAAVYLEEYAPDTRFTRFINVNIRNLAGVPSIVYGLLGLALFVVVFQPLTGGTTAISGGLTLAVLVLPIVVITSAEALRAVPDSIREAGFGVGATRWEVIRSHVLPSAAPGILTGTVLSISRALGETAPVLLVGAVTGYISTGSASLIEQMRSDFTTLPTVVFSYARQPSPEFRDVTSAAIIVLLAVILVVNGLAIVLRNRYERKW